MSGQFSGQVNQTGSQMPGLQQQNGNLFNTPMQNLSGQSNPSMRDAEVIRIRHFVKEKIFEILMRKQPHPSEVLVKKCQDVTRRLEEGLFKSATSKEEYMNMNTLESRLTAFVRRPTTNHVLQHSQFINTPTPVGTMIPTPGLQNNGSSSVVVSTALDPSMMTANTGTTPSSTPSTGSYMPTVNGSFSNMNGGSFRTAEGSLSNGYQQSASSFSMNSGGNNMMVSQRPTSQMIPTPGFSGSNNNQMLIKAENSNNNGIFPNVDSSLISQQVSQRQGGGQNIQMLHSVGSGMRSFMQQRFQNGTSSSSLGNTVNGSGSSDGYLTSSRPLTQTHDPLHQPIVQGDSSGSGNFHNTGASGELLMNSQNGNHVRMSSTSRPSSLLNNQFNAQSSQSPSYIRPHLVDQVEKSKFQPSLSPRENNSQSSMRQYQPQPHEMSQQQFTAYRQQRQPTELSQSAVRNEVSQSQSAFEIGSHVKSENGMEHQNEAFQLQGSFGQIQVSESRCQPQYNSNGNLPRNPLSPSFSSGPQPMIADECANEFSGQPFGAQPEALPHNHFHSDEHVQEEFGQRIVGHEEAQCINVSFEVSSNGQVVAPGSVMSQPRLGGAGTSLNPHHDRQYKNQVRWLLFLDHARGCRAPAGKCPESHCITVQKLIEHMDSCKVISCSYPRCAHTRRLRIHQRNCRDLTCPVCVPYKNFIRAHKKLCTRQDTNGLQRPINGSLGISKDGEAKAIVTIRPSEMVVESPENQPSVKRLKSELPSQSLTSENETLSVRNVISAPHGRQSEHSNEYEKYDSNLQKPELLVVKAEISSQLNHRGTAMKNTISDGGSALNNINSLPSKEAVKLEKDSSQSNIEKVVQPSEQGPGTKSGKPAIKGVSLIELFTPEQVQEHITGLRQWVGQSKAKAEKNQAMEQTMSENSCQLCAVEKLSFEPPPVYCTPCGARIKRNAMYYTVGAGDTRHYICIPCYNESRGDTIAVDGTAIAKGRMEKKKNDEETEEWWVQCDKCEAWQHQICALFNGRRNDGGQAEYTCPNCYMQEVERGERLPLPQSAVLGAKDLPGTALSDHIELRLAKRLKQERQDRARSQGKTYDEVPGVEGVVVRVVSSVDKKLEVKPRFLEIFRDENYPLEFPYKSKVVLLFQKIEGVEVCLYGMYVQEFGSECLPPNQRRVYLSYLDSVKYFRPDVKTATGEALRTFVYHEILIGYLEYCKKRGFASCYIWACPPLKGEDYILYCHPEIQKTPKSDKLREWYLAMLRKASRENIVVELTNLYDHFFIQTGECKAKVTAARLPYFDGDYWPGAAEDLIYQINQEEEGRKLNKKGPTKKIITKRALKASGQLDLSTNASKDVVLMHKLGESIAPMKEDFIMVHLQHACTHCCTLMVSGNRWACELCRNFQLCDRCYVEEERRDDRDRHPINQKDKHGLKKIEITDVPQDTKDKDEILESEFFDTRQAFLSLCQGNHYQYDTLRRAKHSSMMVLYHLHNPTAPAFVTTCNKCHLDIETGQGWRCETCPDYDVCNGCYQKDGGIDHPHKLTNHPSIADRDAQNKEARQQRVLQLRKMLDLLVHASQCRSSTCQYPNCRKVKALFRHGIQCRIRASGGCALCKRMWYLLRLHARACRESTCHVPRCRDLKEHLRRLQQQSDSRRRAAVMEMMRQRAKEVAGSA
ncbi:histone acetyltransferase HAC1-like isoform X2 [Silene latifolia]